MTKEETHYIILKNNGCLDIRCEKCYYYYSGSKYPYKGCKLHNLYSEGKSISTPSYYYILEQEKLKKLKEILK